MDGPPDDWQEGPGLVDSMRRYRWLVASITLLAAVAAFVWSSTQPVLYQGVVRLYLDTSGDETDPAASSAARPSSSPRPRSWTGPSPWTGTG